MSEETKKSARINGGATPPSRVDDRGSSGVVAVSRAEGVAPPAKEKVGARQWRQIALITVAAVGLYAAFRALPTGTNLNHIDFRTGGSPGSLEMCDPANPQFIPVVAVRSPVSLEVSLAENGVAEAGRELRGVAKLATASGKPIGPVDLLVMHTRKLHLLVVDPTLGDYQHLHPEPGARAGEWTFSFTPKRGGLYRIFGDFTPAATGRGLYAGTDLAVREASAAGGEGVREIVWPEAKAGRNGGASYQVFRDGYVFSLVVETGELRAGNVSELAFTIARPDGGAVPLLPVMDAYAHLVAFDEARSGFAHLHPNEADLTHAPDAREPRLTFKITIPQAGRYMIWAQLNLGGSETFVPFPVVVR